eukprot:XP_027302912.1 uncharacterized protein LOC106015970 [Anas platyrhynchos]
MGVLPTKRTKKSCSMTEEETVRSEGSRSSSLPKRLGWLGQKKQARYVYHPDFTPQTVKRQGVKEAEQGTEREGERERETETQTQTQAEGESLSGAGRTPPPEPGSSRTAGPAPGPATPEQQRPFGSQIITRTPRPACLRTNQEEQSAASSLAHLTQPAVSVARAKTLSCEQRVGRHNGAGPSPSDNLKTEINSLRRLCLPNRAVRLAEKHLDLHPQEGNLQVYYYGSCSDMYIFCLESIDTDYFVARYLHKTGSLCG